jgi:hypothetical protein
MRSIAFHGSRSSSLPTTHRPHVATAEDASGSASSNMRRSKHLCVHALRLIFSRRQDNPWAFQKAAIGPAADLGGGMPIHQLQIEVVVASTIVLISSNGSRQEKTPDPFSRPQGFPYKRSTPGRELFDFAACTVIRVQRPRAVQNPEGLHH